MFGWKRNKGKNGRIKQNETAQQRELRRQEILKKRAERRKKKTEPIAKTTTKLKPPPKAKSGSWWERLALFWGYDIGIDLGTANIVICIKGKGIVLDEPAYIARYVATGEVVAVGSVAREMLGRTPKDIEVVRPLREGVIADYDMTEYMLRYFIKRILPSSILFKPRIIVCVPSGSSSVEKRAVLEAALQAGARKTVLIEEPLAAALGTGLDKARAAGAMVVDVGGGTTDVAVLCQTGVVVSESLRIGSDKFDEALIYYMKRKRKILIGKNTAEEMKLAIGTVDRKGASRETVVRGRDLITGLPKAVTVTSKEIQKALEEPIQEILEGIKNILEKTPPELAAEIADHGIILTGGGALIDGFDRLITRSLGIAAYLSEMPLYSVAIGTGRALQEMENLQDTLETLQ